jgi:hypothetical protein
MLCGCATARDSNHKVSKKEQKHHSLKENKVVGWVSAKPNRVICHLLDLTNDLALDQVHIPLDMQKTTGTASAGFTSLVCTRNNGRE